MKLTYTARALPALALAAALGAATTASPALADPERPAPRGPLVKMLRCLSVVDLTVDQKASIKSFLESRKPTMEELLASLRSDHQALEAALEASPADPCAVGGAALELKEDRAALRQELQSIHAGVEGFLTAEQRSRFAGCLAAPGPGRLAGEGPDDE